MSLRPRSLEPITFDPYTIYRGDCLEILKEFPSGCVDLIYIDPPFNSNRNYEVFWGDTASLHHNLSIWGFQPKFTKGDKINA